MAEDSGERLQIFCPQSDGDLQLVIIERTTVPAFPSEVWATISAPVGSVHEIDAIGILTRAGHEHIVGGVVRVGDSLMVRHSVPTSSMHLHEFVVPFHLVMNAAAQLRATGERGSCI